MRPVESLYKQLRIRLEQKMSAIVSDHLSQVTGTGDEYVAFGKVNLLSLQEALKEVMHVWVKAHNTMIHECVYSNLDPADPFLVLLKINRGVTYEEFQMVLNTSNYDTIHIEEKDYQYFRAYDFFKIHDKIDRKTFILNNRYDKDNFQDYCTMLETYRVPSMIFFLKQQLPAMFPLDALLKHAYLTGGSGSGKTELMKLIAYNLQGKTQKYQNASIVIFDPQGDFSRECLKFNMNKDYTRILYVDLYIHRELETYGLIQPKEATFSPVINPFDIDERSIDTVGNMTVQLTKAFEELLKDATITGNMETFLTPCISTLLFREGSSIRDLQRFMQDGNNEDLKQLGRKNPIQDHRNFFTTGGFDMPMYKKTRDALYQKIQQLLNLPNFSRLVVGKSTIDLKHALNSGKVILFNLSKGELTEHTSHAIGKILFAMISGIGYGRVNIEKTQRKNTFVIIDEFQNFAISYVKNMLEEIRQYKIGFFMTQQYAGQGMEGDFLESLLANTTLKIIGKNDANVFRVLSKSTGITENQLKDLPQYTFYVFNRAAKVKKEQQYVQIQPPALLKDTSNTQFYLDTTEYKKLLEHLVFHSGQYRKDETNINDGITQKNTELVGKPFIPKNDAQNEIPNENKPKKEPKSTTSKTKNEPTHTPKPKLPL